MRFWLVCLGGAVGTGARYLLGTWAARTFGPAFPVGTLMINVIGSFLIVIVMSLSLQRGIIPADVRLVLTTGVMGGFTTYSSFNYETLRLFADGSRGLRCCTWVARCSVASRPGCWRTGCCASCLSVHQGSRG